MFTFWWTHYWLFIIIIYFWYILKIVSDNAAKGESRPQLAELYSDVVPKYASDWEDIGIKLGLKKHDLDNISTNNAYNPDRTVECCKKMLNKWLETDTSATWDKLRNAIEATSKQGTY